MKYLLRIYVRPSAGGLSLRYKWDRYEIRECESMEKVAERLSQLPTSHYAHEIYFRENEKWVLLETTLQGGKVK